MWEDKIKPDTNWDNSIFDDNYLIENMPNVPVENYPNLVVEDMPLFVNKNGINSVWLEG